MWFEERYPYKKIDENYEGKCDHCETQVEFKRSEITVDQSTRSGSIFEFDCPSCKGKIRKPFYQFNRK